MKFHPIFYFFNRISEIESRYHSFELKTLAVIYALRQIRIYLYRIKFKIVIDCDSFRLMFKKKEFNPCIA